MARSCSRATLPLFLLILVTSACGGDSGTGVPDPTSITVTPTSATLTSIGATQQFSVSVRDEKGAVMAPSEVSVSWSSSASAVASVSAAGLVTAVGNGTATVTAALTGGAVSGSATITVSQAAEVVTLTLAADTLAMGETTQASAEAADAGGSPLASLNLDWTSSDESVATVDASGLVTAVSEGTTTIGASQDGASGMAELVVLLPDLILAEDTILSGEVVVGEFVIQEGANVTLSGDITIDAGIGVTIAGTLTGDCMAVKIGGDGGVAISGTVTNACGGQVGSGAGAPGIEIDSPNGVDLTDAEIVSSGPVLVVSQPTAGFLASARSGPYPAGTPVLGTVNLTGATIRPDPTEVPQPASIGDPPPHGADFEFRASLDLILDGTTIITQAGGPGIPDSRTSGNELRVDGGNGGDGGDIVLDILAGGTIRFRTARGRVRILAGDGGPGGPATAIATENAGVDPAPSATAFGGTGGTGGSVTIFGEATLQDGSSLAEIEWQVGIGGRGGNATAIGARGVDATSARAAQVGGMAKADAGPGGNAGVTVGGFVGMQAPEGKQGGGGGIARATGGGGGNGIRQNPNGALGGVATAYGGRGGNSTEAGGRPGGDAIADGGNGGDGADVCSAFTNNNLVGQISVFSDPASSDPFIFNAGSGLGLSLVFRVLGQLGGPGGDGGGGALLAAHGGPGGFGREVQAPKGGASLGPGGNGGDGGAGVPGGSGGSAGAPGPTGDSGSSRTNPVFQDGATGGGCPTSVAPLTVFAAGEGDQVIEINGSGAWVDVTGVLGTDGTVTGTGRGTVAGVPDILVEFSGTWDESTKTLTGSYTIDSEKVISAGHPVVYNVSLQGS